MDCRVLNEEGNFSMAIPCDECGAVLSALQAVGGDGEPPKRTDFQQCLNTLYGFGPAHPDSGSVERLLRTLCRAIALRLVTTNAS